MTTSKKMEDELHNLFFQMEDNLRKRRRRRIKGRRPKQIFKKEDSLQKS
jgi:hypothetical protein